MPEIEEARRDEADRALSAVIYLMTCHARTRCPRLAVMIERHLELIGRNPEAGEHVRDTCRRLAAGWECVRRHDEQLAHLPPDRIPARLH